MAESLPLTEEQRDAVERRDGALLVRAGAGTGKTSVLVERFVQAVVAGEAEVEGILAITFTEKAAAEMKSRVRRRFLD
ncbi:MAG TPA: UvrD-helicase domain-containing protein, partial [Thermoleophilaceae bacterium]|nr:UvrD-helicase domain-containing protein [Thermoleophilaceae bacterium]